MAALDHQLGIVPEVTYGTGVTPTKFYEFNSESIEDKFERTEGDPLVKGAYVKRSDRFTPYTLGAAGNIELDVMTKGFGSWLIMMLGAEATTGPTETSVYTHTGTMGDLTGDFFTCQVARPFHPSGTVQVFNYLGGKVTDFELKNSVNENLVASIGCDFRDINTSTPTLAAVSYPTGMEPLSWAGGTVTIGGAQLDVTEFSLKVDNNLNTDRRFISGATLKKEPISGRRSVEFSLKADFASLTERTKVASATRAGTLAQIIAKWQGPTLLGSTIYPNLTVTIPAARFDEWKANAENSDGMIEQELSGVGLWDGSTSPVSLVYQSADVTV